MVKLELNLPWKPVLAWPWGVTYSIDPDTFLITKHEESWDIEPWEVRFVQYCKKKMILSFVLCLPGKWDFRLTCTTTVCIACCYGVGCQATSS